MAAKSWTDSQISYCDCEDQDCRTGIHQGDTLPKRFAFWVNTDRKSTYQTSDNIEDFVIELIDLAEGDPFQTGEATVQDLATRATMDAADFMRKYGKR